VPSTRRCDLSMLSWILRSSASDSLHQARRRVGNEQHQTRAIFVCVKIDIHKTSVIEVLRRCNDAAKHDWYSLSPRENSRFWLILESILPGPARRQT